MRMRSPLKMLTKASQTSGKCCEQDVRWARKESKKFCGPDCSTIWSLEIVSKIQWAQISMPVCGTQRSTCCQRRWKKTVELNKPQDENSLCFSLFVEPIYISRPQLWRESLCISVQRRWMFAPANQSIWSLWREREAAGFCGNRNGSKEGELEGKCWMQNVLEIISIL